MSEDKPLSIRLLGPPEVSFEEQGVRFGRKKALALLCYLVVEGGRHPRRELAELLWPRSEERHARTDLRGILSLLRKILKEDSARGGGGGEWVHLLIVDGDLLGVESRRVEVDLRTLEAAVSLAGSETSSEGGGVEDARTRRDVIVRLAEVLEAYGGDFMEAFSLEDAPEFELWMEAERARWRGVFGELCESLSRLQAEAGDLEGAVRTTRRWVGHAPLEEEAHLRLVELLSATGSVEGALRVYESFRDALMGELGIEPSPRLIELAGRVRGEVGERPRLSASLARSATETQMLPFQIPFAGRHEAFGTLVSEYHACLSDEDTRLVTVLGEAGMGKTRLVEEFLGWARARGADVLEGAATEGARLPYGPLVEALRPRLERERAPDDLLEDAWLSELSRLLPELKERYPDLATPTSGEGGTTKDALFEAIAKTLVAMASRAPVVLFLDDLQWADAVTLEVLDYAGRRWTEQGAMILLIVAARPEETGGGSLFERWLLSIGRRLPVRTLALPPLRNEDVEGLLRRLARDNSTSAGVRQEPGEEQGHPDPARYKLEHLMRWLAAETGGQPLYLVETLKALLEEGKLVVRDSPDGAGVLEVSPTLRLDEASGALLPQTVREAILSRLYRLSPDARDLLVAGAVLGRSFGFETLLGAAGLGESEGLTALDELVGRRLLLEVDDGRGEVGPALRPDAAYSFSHEKIRQVAYTEGGQARRRVLHRRAFEVLEAKGAPSAELARQALAGGLAGQAFAYSVAAGDQAMEVFAVQDAIVHYERTRNLLAEDAQTGGARQPIEASIPNLEYLYTQLGRAYELTKMWREAEAAYETLLALGRRLGEARLVVVALNHLAVLSFPYQKVDPTKAKAFLEEAKRVAEEAGLAAGLVETKCNLADLVSFWAAEPEHSRLPAEEALASAQALVGRQDLIARMLWTLARVEMDAGRLEESAAHAQESAALSRELAERPAPTTLLPSMVAAGTGLVVSWRAGTKAMEIRCLSILAYDRIWQGRLQEGIKVGREGLTKSRALPERAEAMGSWALGPGLVESGEYEEGLALCKRGTEMARELPNVFLLWYNLDNLGRAYETLLDLREARRAYEEALQLRGPLGPRYEKFSLTKLCAVAALSENWEEAYAYALRAREVGTFFSRVDLLYIYHQVEALLSGGDERSAREELHRFAERAEVNERNRISYLRSLAVLSDFEGDQGRAIDHLHEAHTLAQMIGLPGETWQIQARIGKFHERRGEAEQAREAFSRAAQTLTSLAQKIGDEELREDFLSAPQVRRLLED